MSIVMNVYLVSDRVELASNPPSPTPPEDGSGRSSTIIMSALEFSSKAEAESTSNEIGEIDTACFNNGFASDTISMDISSNEKPSTHHRVEFDTVNTANTVNGLGHGSSGTVPMNTCDACGPVPPALPCTDNHSHSPSPSISLFTSKYANPQHQAQPNLPGYAEQLPAPNLTPAIGTGQGQGQGQGGQVRPPRHTHIQAIPPPSEVVECNTLTRSPLGGAGAGAGGSNGTAAGKLQEALSKLRQVNYDYAMPCHVMSCYVMICCITSIFKSVPSTLSPLFHIQNLFDLSKPLVPFLPYFLHCFLPRSSYL